MLASLEKKILKKQYEYVFDDTKLWSFKKKDDALKQINLERNNENNKYKFSFPIDDIHYSTTFDDVTTLKKYIDYILHTHTL
tara:strand:+ start:1649 stop:1894 length:246 start_codon:yes stop_codon:yes gene_type:complete